MANRQKGELDIPIGGSTYTLVLDLEAMIAVEDVFSTPDREVTFQQVMVRVNAGSMKHIRGFLWAAFQRFHPDLSLKDVSGLVQEAGGVVAFSDQIARLASGTTADPEDLAELGATSANPPAAQTGKRNGTGGRSTSRLAATA